MVACLSHGLQLTNQSLRVRVKDRTGSNYSRFKILQDTVISDSPSLIHERLSKSSLFAPVMWPCVPWMCCVAHLPEHDQS